MEKRIRLNEDQHKNDVQILNEQYELHQREVREHFGVDKINRKQRRSKHNKTAMAEFERTMLALGTEYKLRMKLLLESQVQTHAVEEHAPIAKPQIETEHQPISTVVPDLSPTHGCIRPQVDFPLQKVTPESELADVT